MDNEKLEQYKKDCDMQDLTTTKEYIEEAIATNEKILNYKSEGFTRIEKCSLVALYIALTELDNKDKVIQLMAEAIQQYIENIDISVNILNIIQDFEDKAKAGK